MDQELLGSPLRPYRDTQLHLVGQGQLQRVGAGVYRLLENILLWDIRDGRLTPTRVPLTLLRFQPFRGYLRVTHPSQGNTETSTNEKSFKKTLRGTTYGPKKKLPGRAVGEDGLRTLVRIWRAWYRRRRRSAANGAGENTRRSCNGVVGRCWLPREEVTRMAIDR